MVQHLNAKPELITKVFAQRKIAALLQPLLDKKVDTKQKLLEQWYALSPSLANPVPH
jgi:hypothetical protein